jgi:hypothetical protein
MSAAHLRMYQQFGALAVLELLTVATCAVAGPRVADDSQMASALRAMTEDVISQWEILEVRTRAPVLIGSRPRPDPQTPFFCIREVIQLGVDPEGRLLSPEGQAEWMNTNAISPTFRMFALSADGSCSIASDRFFRARTLEGATAPDFVLMIARYLATKTWASSSTKYRLHYLDDKARRCMKGAGHLQILDVKESPASKRSLAYRVVLGGCIDSSTDTVVTADVVLPLDGARADVGLLALSKAEYECVQVECLRDAE